MGRTELAAAALIFGTLGSEATLKAYRRLAACPTGLPLAELRDRCGLTTEALSAALAALEAVGLVRSEGEGADAWYSALVRPLAETIKAVAPKRTGAPRPRDLALRPPDGAN